MGVLAGEELLLQFPIGDVTDYEISLAKANDQSIFFDNLIDIFNDAINSAQSGGAPVLVVANYTKMRDGYVQQQATLKPQCVSAIFKQEQEAACATARRNKAINDAKTQLGYGMNPVTVLGGEDFPQGPVTVEIGGAVFTGSMNGNQLTIDSRASDYLTKSAEGAYNAKLNSSRHHRSRSVYPQCYDQTELAVVSSGSVATNGVLDGQSWDTYLYPYLPIEYSYTPKSGHF